MEATYIKRDGQQHWVTVYLCGYNMSTINYMILSLVIITVAVHVEAKKILRAQEGATKTGRFMVSLDLNAPNKRFDELVEKIGIQANDQKIRKINGRFAKIITAKLSEESLEMVTIITTA